MAAAAISGRMPSKVSFVRRARRPRYVPTPKLTPEQVALAIRIVQRVQRDVKRLSQDDARLAFAYIRKVGKELEYIERGKPMVRRRLKEKLLRTDGRCAECRKPLPDSEFEMDRLDPVLGYVEGNVELVHHECHRRRQRERRFA
jgi:hypothetical protein